MALETVRTSVGSQFLGIGERFRKVEQGIGGRGNPTENVGMAKKAKRTADLMEWAGHNIIPLPCEPKSKIFWVSIFEGDETSKITPGFAFIVTPDAENPGVEVKRAVFTENPKATYYLLESFSKEDYILYLENKAKEQTTASQAGEVTDKVAA